MDKENVRHIEYMHICVYNNEILVIHEKGNPATCDNMHKFEWHYAKWNKSENDKYMLS